MCGIAGYLSVKERVNQALLERMTSTLAHRGPDAAGYYVNPRSQVALGHRRLSIIDLRGGAQPMSNESGAVWVVFNGEIFNYQELRSELEQRGHRFATRSDTEVIVHAYETFGVECVQHFNGMFAFAVWDEHAQRLYLARDRFGKKPLHYAAVAGQFLFASEIKALLTHPAVGRELDLHAVQQYLTHDYVPAPRSIFRDIKKLPPAHWMTVDLATGTRHEHRYWDLTFDASPVRTEKAMGDELLEHLRSAVGCRMISDVPLGVFLSGGIDSSTIAYLMTVAHPSQKIKTFNIAFAEKSFDESTHARAVAKALGTEHYEQVFSVEKLIDTLPEVVEFMDEPLADPSLLPTYLLSKFTRQHVTVALGGDGGDELFAGYPTFAASNYATWYARLPYAAHGMLTRLAAALPTSERNMSLEFKVRQFLKGARYAEPLRTQVWLGAFSPPELARLLTPEMLAECKETNPYRWLTEIVARTSQAPADWLNRLCYQYIHSYLAEDILVKVDRASMAASLEVRCPFLDVRLTDYVAALPPTCKLRRGTSKFLLKQVMRSKLPPRVADRTKKGFGIPVAKWLKGELRELMQDKLSMATLKRHHLFNPGYVQELISEHTQGVRNHRKLLWNLLMFVLWAERFGPWKEGN